MMDLHGLNVSYKRDTADIAFGPQRDDVFDLTLLFEQSILGILPSALFILVSIARAASLWQRETCVRAGWLLWAKLVSRPWGTGTCSMVNISNALLHIGGSRNVGLLPHCPRCALGASGNNWDAGVTRWLCPGSHRIVGHCRATVHRTLSIYQAVDSPSRLSRPLHLARPRPDQDTVPAIPRRWANIGLIYRLIGNEARASVP